jgi:hypothetical protein
MKIDTANEGGQELNKAIQVETNDPKHRTIRLEVIGQIDKVVTINPTIAKLYGSAREELSSEIQITPDEKYAFEIVQIQVRNGKHIRYELETLPGKTGPRYVLKIRNTKKEKGRYFDTLSLKTNSKLLPEITIRVFGKIS